jgi:hypothetical protein
MRYIITEEQNLSLRRRLHLIDKFLYTVLSATKPCDYTNDSHFYLGVMEDLETALVFFNFHNLNGDDIIDYVKKNKEEYIKQYYINSQEDC